MNEEELFRRLEELAKRESYFYNLIDSLHDAKKYNKEEYNRIIKSWETWDMNDPYKFIEILSNDFIGD